MSRKQNYSGEKQILINGKFDEWRDVTPIYRDHNGDVIHRDYSGYDSNYRYINTTGRNDIIESRVTFDKEKVFFYVKTSNKLTSHTDENWMLLFIDVDMNKCTGWEGYDYVINLDVLSDSVTTLKKWENEKWTTVEEINYSYFGKELELGIDKSIFGQYTIKPSFDFHWVDNAQNIDNISGFFLDGDSAPDRRFNYRY